jgi:hypothetical protein
VPERIVMAPCGWKTRSLLERYNIVSTTDLAEGVQKPASTTNPLGSRSAQAGH